MAGDEPSLRARRELGDLLKQARERKGLSLRAAAKQAGVDRGTWTAAEEATRLPQRHKAAAMEVVVGWGPRSFDEVLAGREPTPLASPGSPVSGARWENYRFTAAEALNLLQVAMEDYGDAAFWAAFDRIIAGREPRENTQRETLDSRSNRTGQSA